MKNNTKIKFFLSLIRSVSVLSISAGIYIFSLYNVEIINSLHKKEYLIWENCLRDARSKVFNDSLKEGWKSDVLKVKLDEYLNKACRDKPKRWKYQ